MKYNEKMMEMQLPYGCNLIKRKVEDSETMTRLMKNASGLFGNTFWAYIDLNDEKYAEKNFDLAYLFENWKNVEKVLYNNKVAWANGEIFRAILDCDILLQAVESFDKPLLKQAVLNRQQKAIIIIQDRPKKEKIETFPTSLLSDAFPDRLVRKVQSECGILKINVNFDNADKLGKFQQTALLPFLDIRSSVKGNVAHSGNWTQFYDLNGNLYQDVHDYHDIEFTAEK